jgi:hypothetical protein
MLLYNFITVTGLILLIVQLYLIKTGKRKYIFPMGIAAFILIIIGQFIYNWENRRKKTEADKVAHSWHGLTDGDGQTTGLGWVV